jgi:peptide/nickel transport system permease protein
MRYARAAALAILLFIGISCLFAELFAPAGYETQYRDSPNATPSHRFLLGTDELGRDRFSRLIYGGRVSLVLAPTAALISVCLAALIGGLSGYVGGWVERSAMTVTDLFLSLPWLFLLITVRAVLPLNTSPSVSILITFSLLGILGWAATARVLASAAREIRHSDYVLQAEASGMRGWRLFLVHALPNMKQILLAQFWVSIPIFILAEANLGLLGLGVNEPMPSWGGLLRELENFSALHDEPWRFAPLILLVLVVSAFQIVLPDKENA